MKNRSLGTGFGSKTAPNAGEFIVPGILETNCMKIWVAQPERWMKQTAQSLSSREFYLVYRGTVYWMTAIRMH